MIAFAPAGTMRIVLQRGNTLVAVTPDKPVLRIVNPGSALLFVFTGTNLTIDTPSETGMPIRPGSEVYVLKGLGANTLLLQGREGALVYVTAGETRS